MNMSRINSVGRSFVSAGVLSSLCFLGGLSTTATAGTLFFEYGLTTIDYEADPDNFEGISDSAVFATSGQFDEEVRQNYISLGDGLYHVFDNSAMAAMDVNYTASTGKVIAGARADSNTLGRSQAVLYLDSREYFINTGSEAVTISFTYHYDLICSGPYTETSVGVAYSLIEDEGAYFSLLPTHYIGGPGIDTTGGNIYSSSQFFGSKQNVAEMLDAQYQASGDDMDGSFVSVITLQPGERLLVDKMMFFNSISFENIEADNRMDGEIWLTYDVSVGNDSDLETPALPGTVPEPAEAAIGLGLLALGAACLRRRR